VAISWRWCQETSSEDRKTIKEIQFQLKLLATWRTIESGVMSVRRTSAPNVMKNHITQERLASRMRQKDADSAEKSSSNHLQV